MNRLTQNRLREMLHYDPATGIFKWRVSGRGIRIGKLAGCRYRDGYIVIMIDGRKYLAHRLAWLYCYEYMPENHLDHINRQRDDNRIVNLREVSRQCNARNSGNRCNNTSGVKGVSWHKQYRKWQARIKVNGKQRHLGWYKDFNEAACARLAAEQCLDWSGCDSSSPAYKYVQQILNNNNI